jgi:hypothetical protein
MGEFFMPEKIEAMRKSATLASSFLRDLPGVRVRQARFGGANIMTDCQSEPAGALSKGPPPPGTLTLIKDGQKIRLSATESFDSFVGVEEAYAIEVCPRAVMVPSEYQQSLDSGTCGVILVWTKSYLERPPVKP